MTNLPLILILLGTGISLQACRTRISNDYSAAEQGNVVSMQEKSQPFNKLLKQNEMVITIDETPHPPFSTDLAVMLRQQNVTAVFFNVGFWRLGAVNLNTGEMTANYQDKLEPILANGHLVANHTYCHPIRGAQTAPACGIDGPLGFCELSETRQLQEIVWTNQLLTRNIELLGNPSYRSLLRHWFRSPGNHWSAGCANLQSNLAKQNLGDFEGPFWWNVPSAGNEDIFCKTRDSDPESCVKTYLNDLSKLSDKRAVVLFHGNLAMSKSAVESFIQNARQQGWKIVHPDCMTNSNCAR